MAGRIQRRLGQPADQTHVGLLTAIAAALRHGAPVFAQPPQQCRTLTDAERSALTAGLRSHDAFVLRRCQILLAHASASGPHRLRLSCTAIPIPPSMRSMPSTKPGWPRWWRGPSWRRPSTGPLMRGRPKAAGVAAPESAQLGQRNQPVDAGVSRRDQLRARLDGGTGRPRSGAHGFATAGGGLETGQAVDRQPRPGVYAKRAIATD